MSPRQVGRTRLSASQAAWMTELGIDRRLLSAIADTSALFVSPASVASRSPASVTAKSADPASAPLAATAGLPRRCGPEERPTKVISPAPVAVSKILQSGPLPADLAGLAECVAQCQLCDLHASRHQTVFGAGVAEAPEWMVVGEAPGDHDDHQGLPFRGKAGELLETMLHAAGILPGASVFYTNLLKCRPKGGQQPKAHEIEACLPYLRQQISLVRPRGLLVLGWQAAQALLKQRASLEQLRGQVYEYTDSGLTVPMVVTHHPASLLLRGHHKAAVWRDLHLAKAALKG